jgi:hypothetical protein
MAFQDNAWVSHDLQEGWMAWDSGTQELLVFDGVSWSPLAMSPEIFGVNTSADATSRFAVASDASLFTHDGSDHRLAINRAGELDTASILFQSGHSGRAEIGLTGSDALTVKISADGGTFLPALSILPSTGHIGVGTDSPATGLHVRDAIDARITIATAASGSGGGFDIMNYADAQNWRVTGQNDLFKLRDHTAGLDKLVLQSGAGGDVFLQNCGNVGIGTSPPAACLHVDGAVRIGAFTSATLPDAAATGAGRPGLRDGRPGRCLPCLFGRRPMAPHL